MRSTRWIWLWTVVGGLLWACGTGSTTSAGDLELPTITGLPGEFMEVAPGETVSITLSLTNEGIPAEDYRIIWDNTMTQDDGDLQYDSPGPGLERMVFIPRRIGVYRIEAAVMVPASATLQDDNALFKRTPSLVLRVRGGDCSEIIPDVSELVLGVGEARSVSAEALTQLPEAQQTGVKTLTVSQEPIEMTIADGDVASVDEEGVVTGKDIGETTLTFACGAVTTEISVIVTEDEAALPIPGRHPMIARQTRHFAADLDQLVGSIENRLVHTEEGYPMGLVQPAGGVLQERESMVHRLLLATWTGTGFCTEELGTPWVSKRYPHLALGTGNEVWVSWMEEGVRRLQVANRNQEKLSGGWNVRSLPVSMDLDNPERPIVESDPGQAWTPSHHLAMIPDPTDGVWIAYTLFDDSTDESHATRHCTQVIRLVKVRSSGYEAEDLFNVDIPATDNGPDGCADAIGANGVQRLALRYGKASASRPQVWALEGDTGLNRINKYTFDGESWIRNVFVDPEEFSEQEPKRAEPLDFALVTNPQTPEEAGVVWAAYRQPEHDELLYWAKDLPQNHNWRTWFPLVENQNQYLYSMHLGGRSYLGDRNVGPLMIFTPQGTLLWEDPAKGILPDATDMKLEALRSYSAVVGHDVTDDRLAWMVDGETRGIDYLSHVVAVPLKAEAEESKGTRLTTEPQTPRLVGKPTWDADGSRWLLVDFPERPEKLYVPYDGNDPYWPEPGRALYRGMPGEAPVPVPDDELEGLNVSILTGTPFVAKSKLTAIEQWQDAFQVKQYNEGVWEQILDEAPCNGKVLRHALTDNGALFVLCAPVEQGDSRNFQVWFAPKILKGVSWSDKGGAPEGYEGPNYTNGDSVALLQDGNEVTVVVLLKGPGSWYAQVRRYGSDGIVLQESLNTIDDIFLPHTATLASDGSIVALHFYQEDEGYQWFTVRSSDGFSTVNRKIFGEPTYGRPAPLVRLDDGRLLMASDNRIHPEVRKAFYRTSADNGATWSEAGWIRPEGGAFQQVDNLVVQPDGTLLVVLEDNGSSRTWEHNDVSAYYPANALNDLVYPSLETGLLVLESP